MTSTLRSFCVVTFFALAAVGCGGGGSGGGDNNNSAGNSSNPPSTPDVTVAQLSGTWRGTFDDKTNVHAMEIVIDNGNITGLSLDGVATNLSGPITKASGAPRAFTFELKDQSTPPSTINRGTFFADPTGAYLVYLDSFFDAGVVQKDATTLPSYAQADIQQSWAGDAFTMAATSDSPPGFNNFTQATTSASCTATTPPGSSKCDITNSAGGTRTVGAFNLDDPKGRYLGNFTDAPSGNNGTIRAYLSADKKFGGVWACQSLGAGYPSTCDFSTWTR